MKKLVMQKNIINNWYGNSLSENSEKSKNSNYMNLLSIDATSIMGYLEISKINVNLPIYHGSNKSVLQVGIGHLEGSSLPVEGDSTHVVLAGHTGLSSARLLSDLDKMEKGDNFNINVLNKIYSYEVDKISVVDPSDTEQLKIEEGRNLVTLVTCTPVRSKYT